MVSKANNHWILVFMGCYVSLCFLYFSHIHLPSKLVYPVALLGIIALADGKHIGWLMAIGLVFSAFGDWQGTQGNFLGQMGCFGLAHLAYIGYFGQRIKQHIPKKQAVLRVIPALLLGIVAFTMIVPHAPQGIVQMGVSIYCVLILTMLWMALLQNEWWFGTGAALFVLSDFILAWNKFVNPIDHVSWFIMVPYYTAQWQLFMRAITVASGDGSYTSQDR